VARVEFPEHRVVVAKAGPAGADLRLEGWMLGYLGERGWPVPQVHYRDEALLILEYVAHNGRQTSDGERRAADLLAALHGVAQPSFGFERDTVIAGLAQANPRTDHWIEFFAEQRLLAMAAQAQAAGQLDGATRDRVERLAARVDRWLVEPEHPSLIHGDLWGGNILFHEDRVAAVIDPACYWADAEIELAFTTLFSTFGETFYARYQEQRPLAPGFFEERCELYNLYPLLVHVTLFGGAYLGSVQRTLQRFGV
jgi:fructosamine-3-kinase